jgi:hypothetical protein
MLICFVSLLLLFSSNSRTTSWEGGEGNKPDIPSSSLILSAFAFSTVTILFGETRISDAVFLQVIYSTLRKVTNTLNIDSDEKSKNRQGQNVFSAPML